MGSASHNSARNNADYWAMSVNGGTVVPEIQRAIKELGAGKSLRERIQAEHDALERTLVAVADRLRRKAEQLAQLDSWPIDDPFQDGDRLQFEKSFPGTPDKRYSYLALRVDGRYHITGARSPQNITWEQFVNWAGLGVNTVYKIGPKGGKRKVISL